MIEKKRLVASYIRQGKSWQDLVFIEFDVDSEAIEFAAGIPSDLLEQQPDALTLKEAGYDLEFNGNRAVAVAYRVEYLRQQAIRDAKQGKRQWEGWMVLDRDSELAHYFPRQ